MLARDRGGIRALEVCMKKYPVKLTERLPRPVAKAAADVVSAQSADHPFFSFRYSCVELSTAGSRAHVKARSTRLEDGKLTSEAFEGDLDRATYDRMVTDAQRHFLAQSASLLKVLSLFLPFSSKHLDRE